MPRNSSKAPTQRQLRVGEEIRHALAEVFERGDVHDPAVAGVPLTVSEVKVSPDLRNATAYVMRLGGGEMTDILKGLRKARAFLRHQVGARMTTKFTPDLRFEVDPTYDYAAHIDDILHRPDVARDLAPRTMADLDLDMDEPDFEEEDFGEADPGDARNGGEEPSR